MERRASYPCNYEENEIAKVSSRTREFLVYVAMVIQN